MTGQSDLLAALQTSFSQGSGLAFPEASAPVNHNRVALSNSMQTALANSYEQGIQQNWSLGYNTRPLSEEEVTFLRSHSVTEIGGKSSKNPFVGMVITFVQQVATAILKNVVQNALTPAENHSSPSHNAHHHTQHSSSHGHASHAEHSSHHVDGHSNAHDVSSHTYDYVHGHSHPGDPSLQTMKKLAKSAIQSRAIKIAGTLLQDQMPAESKEFIKRAGIVVGAAVKTAKFMNSVEEKGFQVASAEVAASTVTDYVVKSSIKVATTFVGCANPIWCAGVVTTIVRGIFTVTETAPSSLDMYGHFPTLSFPQDTGSHLPSLNPNLGPAFRAPPN
ncbi:MAG: hypothetical protein LLF94_04460 [Chlamydiales bacterium]|nr:hypothetical protein [Chlamydiales bacterium]